ncbi:MAG: hypothetical protein DMF75_02605 [Acidobacteria bacterium]|nr:MAG: hypothetical protein DMF75_02605 [Acidobacteriota bacterium]
MIDDDAKAIQESLSKLSRESIQGAIGFVTGSDLTTVQIDEIKRALSEVLSAYGKYAKQIGPGQHLFRAMKHKPHEKRFQNLSRIYPDPGFLTTLGRANREHQAMYYFSGDCVVALHEVRATPGDVITILECVPRDDSSPMLVPIGIDELLARHGVKAGGDFPDASVRIQDLLIDDKESLEKYWSIDEFVRNEFLKEVGYGSEHQYKTTVAIAESLFSYGIPSRRIDGLAYPTIAAHWTHTNIALPPDTFHHFYEPLACHRIKISGLLPNLGFSMDTTFGLMTKQIDSDGEITWPEVT